jgi:hypothetical protein
VGPDSGILGASKVQRAHTKKLLHLSQPRVDTIVLYSLLIKQDRKRNSEIDEFSEPQVTFSPISPPTSQPMTMDLAMNLARISEKFEEEE